MHLHHSSGAALRSALILALSVAALATGAGCGGGSGKGGGVFTTLGQRFTLSTTPSSLAIPSGGSGYLTVSVTRYGGFADAIALTVENLPAGVVASGTVAAGANTGRLTLTVADGVTTQSLGTLVVKGTSGSRTQTASLALSILDPLPPSSLSPSRVQAVGGRQVSGNIENHALALEPVGATEAQNSSGSMDVRHGFLPVSQPSIP